ncbi:MAG: diguanylate cyclase [Vibrio sp.]|uniref:diguanylate cyclase n=1 Tax=Vibrio sp. TaxID=678 RepID=UPI003A866B97
MTIHIPTVFLMIIATSGALGFSVGWVARAKQDKELLLWTVGLLLQTLVYVLFFLRDQTSTLISVIFANIALSASYSCFLAAINEFHQRTLSRLWYFAPPLVLGVTFSFMMDSISSRIIVSGLIFASQCMFMLFALLKYKAIGRGKYLMVGSILMVIGVLAIRVTNAIFKPDDITSMLHQTPTQVLTFFTVFISLILSSNGFVLMIKERADECILMIAMKDRLTGIWNRVRLEEEVQKEIDRSERYGHPASLIMLDLDFFKKINDQFGHRAGDLILKEFCLVVKSCIRTTDVLARWGGEEFVVLLPNTGFSQATGLAERIRVTIEKHEFHLGLRITASLGFSTCQPDDTLDSWLERADKALYRAKSAGRNCVKSDVLSTKDIPNKVSPPVQLVWHAAYKSGNDLIDTQHRTLFEQANTLFLAIIESSPKAKISSLVDSLILEIEQHFKDEESIFQRAKYPRWQYHQTIHSHLLKKAKDLSHRYDSGEIRESDLLHFFLYEMISQHVLIEDSKYFSSLTAE